MRHLLTGFAVTTTLLAACGGPATPDPDAGLGMTDAPVADAPRSDTGRMPDAFVRADAFMPIGTDADMVTDDAAMDDAAMMAMDDAAMMATDDAAMMMMDDAAMMMMADDAFVPMADAFTPPSDAGFTGDAGFMGDAFTPPPPNDICNTAIVATAGMTSGTTRGAADDYGTGANCAGTAGLDVVYAIDVPAGQTVTVTVDSGDGTFDPSISLVAGPAATCGGTPRMCLSGDDSGVATTTNSASYTNTGAMPTRIFAVVDNFEDTNPGGPFNLNVAFMTPPANDTCATALAITPSTVMSTTAGSANDYGTGTGCTGTAGLDVVYALTVPAGQRAVVTVVGTGGAFDPSINLVAGPAATCGGSPRTCLASDDAGGAATVNRAAWLNTTGASAVIYAVVDTSHATRTGTFTLTYALETPPAGDFCSNAVRVAAGTTMSTTAGHGNDLGTGTMCTGTAGADRVYVISVAAGQTLTATVTSGDGTFDPSINLEVMCGATPRVCVDGDDAGAATAVNTVTHMNTGAAAQDVFISIETAAAGTTGPFTMTVALAP